MNKLMVAAVIAAVAAVSQAASFTWTSSDTAYALDAAGVTDNGDYGASSSVKVKGSGTWNYTLTLYAAGTETVVDTLSGTLNTPGSGKIGITTSDSDKVSVGTAYDYILEISGMETALNSRGKEAEFDYTNAELAYTYAKGNTGALIMGANTLAAAASPSTWTVSGITAVPEPTSGLLLLLGVAGLALRRRRA